MGDLYGVGDDINLIDRDDKVGGGEGWRVVDSVANHHGQMRPQLKLDGVELVAGTRSACPASG